MLYRRDESSFWWIQFKHRGQRFRFSTGTTDRKAAEVEARRLRVQVEQETGPGGRGSTGVTLGVLEQLHVELLERKGRDERRISTIENMWRHIHEHLLEHTDIMTLSASDIERYEGLRRKDGARGQTIRRERQALHRGMRLAKRDGLIPRMPFDWDDLDQIESDPPLDRQEAKVRDLADIERALAALSSKAKAAGYPQMLRFILWTGLRLEEFWRYDPSWVRPAPKRSGAAALLFVPANASKTGDARTVPLLKATLAVATEWGHRFAGTKFHHALKLACSADRANLSPMLTARDLRATYLDLAAKGDPVAAQKLGGHRNISTTGLYLDASSARAVAAGVRAAKEAGGHRTGPQQQHGRRKAQ